MIFNDRINAATENMVKLFELSGGVSHGGEKGVFREYFLSEVVYPCIPRHFGITSGIVVDAWDRQSTQIDLVIYDQRKMPPILETGNTGIIPFDSVLAVLEVKSTLKSSDLSTLANAAWRMHPDNPDGLKIKAKGNLEGGQSYYPLYGIFGYQSDAEYKDEEKRLKEQSGRDLDLVKLICVLNKGIWVQGSNAIESQDKNLVMTRFLIHFLNKLEETSSSRGEFYLSDWLTT